MNRTAIPFYRLVIYFIYLLTLFNVDYKKLEQLCANQNRHPPSHKKHNKNVNKNEKEVNRMCTVLSNKPYNTC